jgi:hypothetical protein
VWGPCRVASRGIEVPFTDDPPAVQDGCVHPEPVRESDPFAKVVTVGPLDDGLDQSDGPQTVPMATTYMVT